MIKKVIIYIMLLVFSSLSSQMVLARLHYSGGGDWYNNPEVLPNLAKYANEKLNTNFLIEEKVIQLNDAELADYPFIYATGHGNIKFSDREATNLKEYLIKGGFLYVDDDYGLDKSFRNEISKVFPKRELVELPISHELFSCYYKFKKGTPKIHKHDDKRPRSYAIFDDYGRIMVLYTFEANISDGWADANTHKDSVETRTKALNMGVNILYYILMR